MFGTFLAWENSWHFTMPAAVPLYPDLKSASDWMKQISNQTEALCGPGLCMSTVWNFYARFSDVINFHGETTGGIVKSWLFSQAITPSRVWNCAFLVANATKNSVLATRNSQLVASWRLVKLVVIVDFHVRRKWLRIETSKLFANRCLTFCPADIFLI